MKTALLFLVVGIGLVSTATHANQNKPTGFGDNVVSQVPPLVQRNYNTAQQSLHTRRSKIIEQIVQEEKKSKPSEKLLYQYHCVDLAGVFNKLILNEQKLLTFQKNDPKATRETKNRISQQKSMMRKNQRGCKVKNDRKKQNEQAARSR